MGNTRDAAKVKLKNVEEFLAHKETVEGLKANYNHAADQTFKVQVGAAVGGAAAAGGAAYGYKKARDHQKAETAKLYSNIMKRASVGGLLDKGLSVSSKILRTVGHTAGDMIHTSTGGKIRHYATQQGLKHGSKEYKSFVGGTAKEQYKTLLKNKTNRFKSRDYKNTIKSLHRDRRDATIGLGATASAGLSGYALHKSRQQVKQQQYY